MDSKQGNRPLDTRCAGGRATGHAASLGGGIALVLLALPSPALGFDWSLKIEPGFAVPLTAPQSENFGSLGGGASLKGLFGLGSYVDAGPTAMFVGLSAQDGAMSTDTGIGWGIGGGLRVNRPHDRGRKFNAVSPWMDTDILYVRTGPLDRFGFALAAGLSFPVDEARRFWVGPFLRYFQIVQTDRPGFDNTDAKIIMVGLTFEGGSTHSPPTQPVMEENPCACMTCPGTCPAVAAAPAATPPRPRFSTATMTV